MRKGFYPLALVCLIIPGCVSGQKGRAPPPTVGMANPASVYCVQQGGKSIPVQTAAGERADCLLPNGKRVDEWNLYRSTHK